MIYWVLPAHAQTKFPNNPVGNARAKFEEHIFAAQEVCHHIIGKLNTLMKSNAYKTASNFADVKDLHIHLSYLFRYTTGRFQTLQEKSQLDVAKLDRLTNAAIQAADRRAKYDNDEDDLHVVEPTIDQIEIDESDDEEAVDGPTSSTVQSSSTPLRHAAAAQSVGAQFDTYANQSVAGAAEAVPPLAQRTPEASAPAAVEKTPSPSSVAFDISADRKLRSKPVVLLVRVDPKKITASGADADDNETICLDDSGPLLVEGEEPGASPADVPDALQQPLDENNISEMQTDATDEPAAADAPEIDDESMAETSVEPIAVSDDADVVAETQADATDEPAIDVKPAVVSDAVDAVVAESQADTTDEPAAVDAPTIDDESKSAANVETGAVSDEADVLADAPTIDDASNPETDVDPATVSDTTDAVAERQADTADESAAVDAPTIDGQSVAETHVEPAEPVTTKETAEAMETDEPTEPSDDLMEDDQLLADAEAIVSTLTIEDAQLVEQMAQHLENGDDETKDPSAVDDEQQMDHVESAIDDSEPRSSDTARQQSDKVIAETIADLAAIAADPAAAAIVDDSAIITLNDTTADMSFESIQNSVIDLLSETESSMMAVEDKPSASPPPMHDVHAVDHHQLESVSDEDDAASQISDAVGVHHATNVDDELENISSPDNFEDQN